ncbi:hypothetical protein Micbo1qcDRAFT_209104 [Microdochium bolleyi]|uniref:Uncharacterized protein n=1 Tax=Microdochium bolleyi TaxID=196109 RepID=A0A136ING9_9PEZI|nr:hypothetical protein Micbo1qcDRAFT_209104 [Microdochium bolleyi]
MASSQDDTADKTVHFQARGPTDDTTVEPTQGGRGQADVEKQLPADDPAAGRSTIKPLGWSDRFLAAWVLFAMVIGDLVGNFMPQTADALNKGKFVGVSVPIAVGLLVMMYPILQQSPPRLALAWMCLRDKPELRTGLILFGLPYHALPVGTGRAWHRYQPS